MAVTAPSCWRCALHEVAVVADLVVAALVVAALHEVARHAGADAQEHDTRR